MATQNQNPQNENQPNQNPQDQNSQNPNPANQGSAQSPSSQPGGKNESTGSEKQDRGLEQNDHTYEGENDVTHSPEKTGQPEKQGSSEGSVQSEFAPESSSQTSQAGYAQQQHDKTPEQNAKNTNASDPKKSEEPRTGNL